MVDVQEPVHASDLQPGSGTPQLPDRSGYFYLVSGLTVVSEIRLPPATPLLEVTAADITISSEVIPYELPFPCRRGDDWQLAGDRLLLSVTGVARFLIEGGRSIRFTAERDADPGDVVLFLLGTCLAALLLQRGHQVLHASAVAVGGSAVLFCGPSGSGKSTLAALLCQHGYALINDDTCNLMIGPEGHVVAAGDGRMLKLWNRSLEYLDLARSASEPVRTNTDKFYMTPAKYELVKLPVAAIYILSTIESGQASELVALGPFASLIALREQTYRPSLIEAMELNTIFFEFSARLLQQVTIQQLRRPLDFELIPQSLKLLKAHWIKLGLLSPQEQPFV